MEFLGKLQVCVFLTTVVVKVLLVLRLQNLAFLKIPSKTPLCCSCSSRPLLLLQVMYLELSTTQVVAKVKDTDLVVRHGQYYTLYRILIQIFSNMFLNSY